MLKTIFSLAIFTLFALLLTGCKPALVQIEGKTMGTYYTVKYIEPKSPTDQKALHAGIEEVLEQVNAQMSTYRPNSEISRFNRSQQVNVPFIVSPAMLIVVREAIRIHQLTDGSLDITTSPLVNLWGFGPEKRTQLPPTDEEIAQRLSWVGIDKLKVEGNGLIKLIPELSIDLSAIAKGYGVDAVSEYLESRGVSNYMVDIGGEVRARGKNDENPWRIAIERPVAELTPQVQKIIELNDMSVATSGDYRNYFEADGVRYSHTIDPKTGRPITHALASITVIAPTCMTADGMATGLGVLGPDEGMALANKLDIAVYMLVKTDNGFEERYSEAFKRLEAVL